ncbi:MAG: histidine kinase [Acidobacteria bacterium]|nr:histidine kinase [Acidobacteriota bacterium]MBV9478839.1 histidine kinase [Acidobacteriota bacterium]
MPLVLAAAVGLLIVGPTPSGDQATRFAGAEQAVNVFTIGDDSDNVVASPYVWRPRADAFVMRQTVTLTTTTERTRCVYVSMLARSETFWDGRRIGRSGTIDAAGPLDNFYVLPAALARAGPHALEIRVAHPDVRVTWFQGVVIGDYERMLRSRIVGQVVPLSGFAVFVVIGIYYVTLSFASRRRGAMLTFALLCFAAALLAVAETWRWTVGYAYDVQPLRIAIITALTFCVSLLLPAFFALELELRRPRVWLTSFALVLAAVAFIPNASDDRCLLLFQTSMLLSAPALAVAARAQTRRAVPGIVALAILVAALVRFGFRFSDNAFFIAFCAAIACLLVSMAIELRRERRERASLELALLRKTIEPHFVMNTLTAVMEWIEHDPAAGVGFLEAFADELRLFSKIAHDAAIPLADELALCRSHLAVMSARKAKRFHLRADGVDAAATIPPAVLHTLVENALTHNRYRADEVEFVLSVDRRPHARRYVFDAPLGDTPAAHAAPEGTGLRYVKARLEERYPGKWSLTSEAKGAHWRTTIEVPV